MNIVNRLVSLNIIQLAIFPMECGNVEASCTMKIHSSSSTHIRDFRQIFMLPSHAEYNNEGAYG